MATIVITLCSGALTANCAARVVSPCTGKTTLQVGFSDPLIAAAGNGELAKVQKLTRNGHDVNYQECDDFSDAGGSIVAMRGRTPLMVAAENGHIDVVRFLFSAGAKLGTRTSGGDTALALAVKAQREDVVSVLKALGATE